MKLRAVALAVIWTAAFPNQGIAATTSPPDVSHYIKLIHSAYISLRQLELQAPIRSSRLDSVRRLLQSLDKVQLPDGRQITTQTASLAEELRSGSPAALRYTDRQLAELEYRLRTQPIRNVSASRLNSLDQIVNMAQFQHESGPIQRIASALKDWFRQVLQVIPSAVMTGPLAATLFAILVLALGGVASLFAIRRVTGTFAIRADGTKPRGRHTLVDARREAARHAEARDYRTALRYVFLECVLELQDSGFLTARPGRTNLEYLHEVQMGALKEWHAARETVQAFQDLIDAFERTWYGHAPIDAAEFAICRALASTLVAVCGRSFAA